MTLPMFTYSLRVIVEFLKDKNINFKISSPNIPCVADSGCKVILSDRYMLSIQTHPLIAGEYFAETALQDKIASKIVYDGKFGYYDVLSHSDPKDLFEHIEKLLYDIANEITDSNS